MPARPLIDKSGIEARQTEPQESEEEVSYGRTDNQTR